MPTPLPKKMIKKTTSLTVEAINKAIKCLNSATIPETAYTAYLPTSLFYDKILSKRYKGKGRPKESDYDFKENTLMTAPIEDTL